jgi:hypothetical protein
MISTCGEPVGPIAGDQGLLDIHATLPNIQGTLKVDIDGDLDRKFNPN